MPTITSQQHDLTGLPGLVGVPLPLEYRIYRWGWAPVGLATRRQLARLGLRPTGREPVAQITWGRRRRVAYLWRVDAAAVKQPPTPAQSTALAAAMRARRTCSRCGVEADYCLPTRYSARGTRACLTCLDQNATT